MRLIDADAIIPKGTRITPDNVDLATVIRFAPTVDAVPVVRCRECSKWQKKDETWLCKGFGYCTECMMDCPADHYCSYGERR